MQASDLVQTQFSVDPASTAAPATPDLGDGSAFPQVMRSSLVSDTASSGTGEISAGIDDGKKLPRTAALAAPATETRDPGEELVPDSVLVPDPALAALMQRFSSDPHRPLPVPTDSAALAAIGIRSVPVSSRVESSGIGDVTDTALPQPAVGAALTMQPAFSSDPGAPLPVPTDSAALAAIGIRSVSVTSRVGSSGIGDATDTALPQPAVRAGLATQPAFSDDAGAALASAAIGVAMADAVLPDDAHDTLELRLESAGVRSGSPLPELPTFTLLGGATPSPVSAPTNNYQAWVHAESVTSVAMWDHAIGQQLMGMIERGQQHARLTLHPSDLGQIDIRLNLGADRVDLNFAVQQPVVAQALQQSMPQLAQMLGAHGLALGQTQVAHQDVGQERGGQPSHVPQAEPDGEPAAGIGESVDRLRIAVRGLFDAFA